MEYNCNQYPDFGTTKSSLNHIVNPNLAKSFPLNDHDTVSSLLPELSSNISASSMTCGSRSIHVNRTLYYHNHDIDLNRCSKERNKTDRVYYNPKFLKNNATVPNQFPMSQVKINKYVLKKQEPNIYVNPHFIKNDNSNIVATHKKSSLLINPLYRSGIHFNPKFFKDQIVSKNNETVISLDHLTPQECHSDAPDENCSLSRYISKYKIIKKKINSSTISKCGLKKSNTSLLRKYKTNREKLHPDAYSYLNKYAFKKYLNDRTQLNSYKKIKQCIQTSPKPVVKLKEVHGSEAKTIIINRKKSILQQKIEARRKGKSFIMYGFRNYLSKYKYRRTPETTMKFSEISPKSHYSKHHYHKANSQNVDDHADKSVFKTISKMKLVRKSILQTQIESRRYAKKSIPLQRVSQKGESHISKYKIVHSLVVSKRNLSQKTVTGVKKNPMTFSSKNYRADKLKRLHNLTKKLRKNNQPCSFFNRYGRCKGIEKGSCPKVHDPKYVAICKKFLKGECKEECTLSHDIRPEKMPTCYHYLAGLCKRTNCPYLHIKVNRKAPICRAFLLGFCAEVYTCNKRHEFICPVFVEKGYCLKGKSCSLPHRTPSICSKLLKPDQFPLLNDKQKKKYHRAEVSKTDKHLEFKETIIENDSTSSNKEVDRKKTDGKDFSKHFQRYFLASLSANESVENDNEPISTTTCQS